MFNKRTVKTIMSAFHNTMNDLMEHSVDKQIEAQGHLKRADKYTKLHDEAASESIRALRIHDKLLQLVSE